MEQISSRREIFRDVHYYLQVYAEAIGESKADLTGIKAEGRMPKEGSVTIPARELGVRIVSFLLRVCMPCVSPWQLLLK